MARGGTCFGRKKAPLPGNRDKTWRAFRDSHYHLIPSNAKTEQKTISCLFEEFGSLHIQDFQELARPIWSIFCAHLVFVFNLFAQFSPNCLPIFRSLERVGQDLGPNHGLSRPAWHWPGCTVFVPSCCYVLVFPRIISNPGSLFRAPMDPIGPLLGSCRQNQIWGLQNGKGQKLRSNSNGSIWGSIGALWAKKIRRFFGLFLYF